VLLCGTQVTPLMQGGTGSNSLRQDMPDFLPDRLEAGTHNIPGIAGLLEGIRFLRRIGIDKIGAHESRLVARMTRGLERIKGVQVYAQRPGEACQSGVLSFRVNGMDCEEVGHKLARAGFAVRCGLHCAPLAHESAGTLESGTVRASVSAYNSEREVRLFVRAVAAIKK